MIQRVSRPVIPLARYCRIVIIIVGDDDAVDDAENDDERVAIRSSLFRGCFLLLSFLRTAPGL